MKSNREILSIAKDTFLLEAQSVSGLIDKLTDDFAEVVKMINSKKSRVIMTGIGKSALIASKIVATLNSTGTRSIFMHAADAIHGDLGMIEENDVVICISKSGNTPEVQVLVPLVKNLASCLVAITGNTNSYLAQQADFVLDTTVSKEACPNNLAPTSSTTAQLVMGDALAVCLEEMKGFSPEDFARFHPGGSLGKRLYLKVDNIIGRNERPNVTADTSIKDVINEISSKRLGVTAVSSENRLIGVITDGDIRRMLENNDSIAGLCAQDIMSTAPKTINAEALAVKAFEMLDQNEITTLLVTKNDEYVGVVHLHDLIREGII